MNEQEFQDLKKQLFELNPKQFAEVILEMGLIARRKAVNGEGLAWQNACGNLLIASNEIHKHNQK